MSVIRSFLEDEAQDTVGKVDIACGLVLLIFAIMGTIPSLLMQVLRVILNRPAPSWTIALPLVALGFLIVYFYFSLRMIPPKAS